MLFLASFKNSDFTYRSADPILKRDDQVAPHRLRADRALFAVSALALANAVADSALLPVLPTLQERFESLRSRDGRAALGGDDRDARRLRADRPRSPGGSDPAGCSWPALRCFRSHSSCKGLATGLGMLMAGRALFGLSFAILWTVAPAVAAGSDRGAAGTGRLIAAAGAGWLIGPAFSGVMTDMWGYRVAFVAIALGTLPLVYVLARVSLRGRTCSGRTFAACALRHARRACARWRDARHGAARSRGRGIRPARAARPRRQRSLGGRDRHPSSPSPLSCSRRAARSVTRIPSWRVDVRLVGATAAVVGATFLIPFVSFSTFAMVGFLDRVGGGASGSRLGRLRACPLTCPARGARDADRRPDERHVGRARRSRRRSPPESRSAQAGAKWAFVATAAVGFVVAAWMLVPRSRTAYA